MPKAQILIVEDDRSLAEVLDYNLRQDGYQTTVANDGQDGLQQAKLKPPDLVVLDLMLPMIDGLEICRRLRADPVTRNMLVLMLTAKTRGDGRGGRLLGRHRRLRGQAVQREGAAGADSRAACGAATAATTNGNVLVSQGMMIDRERHRVTVDDELLDLTPSEFGLLEALIRQPGRVFSRSELIDSALGGDSLVLERTIDVHIRSLRKKLGPHAVLVETVRGIGYRFRDPISAVDVEIEEEAAVAT